MRRLVIRCLALTLVVFLCSCFLRDLFGGFQVDQSAIDAASINRQIEQYLEQAETSDDINQKARLLGLASALLAQKGDYTKAARLARAARRENPSQKDALATLGECYIATGRLREAELILQEALIADPEFVRAHYLLGNAHSAARNWTDARASYETALEFDSENVDVMNNLAAVLVRLNQAPRALSLLEAAIAINPELASLQRNAGLAAQASGRRDQARAYFERYLQLNPAGGDRELVQQWIGAL
ncbi:MAG: tetratricopeptide repeat protein [Spirochaetales bacterium]|nr:tetratricopeptide repeat protein [Leptospiraceae bacterium]MCP5481333.1 tetratricopeptide repeat protein [Spirochaetales bacterium]MCP5485771.1 tetratricopeptide repeat protein [Spirochaetales bacterium]